MKQGINAMFTWGLLAVFVLMLVMSWLFDWSPGVQIGAHFQDFIVGMLRVFPCAFILIGLFDVWVKQETIQRHMGEGSGCRGYVWALLLAGTTVGGMFVGFPVAYALYNKGAKLSIVFTYIGAAAICRVPMSLFEAFYLGGRFTLIRFAVSLPLLILSSILLGTWLTRHNYQVREGQ
jgi:uncharacterized membrane protein YraQ (UPF0718 family)